MGNAVTEIPQGVEPVQTGPAHHVPEEPSNPPHFRIGPRHVFRKTTQETQDYVEREVGDNPPTFRPETEHIHAVLDNTENQPSNLRPVPRIEEDTVPNSEVSTTSLSDRLIEILHNPEVTEASLKDVAQGVQDSAREIIRQAEEIKTGSRDSRARAASGMLRIAGPIIIALTALIPRDSADVENKNPNVDLPSGAMTETMDGLPSYTSELGPATVLPPDKEVVKTVDYTVRAGDSIASILAKMYPEKYLDENGRFKTDNATQDDLYTRVGQVLEFNRDTLLEENSRLYQAKDQIDEAGQPTSGLDLKHTVERVTGPYERVIIEPGQVLKMPVENGNHLTNMNEPRPLEHPVTSPLSPVTNNSGF